MSEWKVGQTVYFISNERHTRDPVEMVITRLGRKWATASLPGSTHASYRFDVQTGDADGGGYSSPGTVWESLDAYWAHKSHLAKWGEFKQKVDRCFYNAPPGVTTDAIERAMALLFPAAAKEVN